MQCIDHDKNRLYMKDELARRKLSFDTDKERYIRFTDFLLDPALTHHLQTYILLCGGFYNREETIQRLTEIISDFEFTMKDGYTFGQIFNRTEEWYDFYKENAYPTGQLKKGEARRGVTKKYVDDIMTLHDRLNISLEQAIVMWSSLNYRIFCIINITNPYYGKRLSPCN